MLQPLFVLAAAAAALLPVQASTFLRVYSDGGGDYSSITSALASVSPATAGALTLQLRGYFFERVNISAAFEQGVTFLGLLDAQGARPLITYNVSGSGGSTCSGSGGPGTFGSATLENYAPGLTLAGVDVANSACNYNHKVAGQSVALMNHADRLALFNVSLLGSQDTLYTGETAGRAYFHNVFINGTCDALFGSSAAVFEACTIRMNFTVTAQRGSNATALLILDSSIDAMSAGGSVLLGRPWGPQARVVLKNTWLGQGVDPLGWSDWGHNCTAAQPHQRAQTWCADVFYAEYNSTGPGAAHLDRRVWWSYQLDQAGASAWTKEGVLGGWTPVPPPPPPATPLRRGGWLPSQVGYWGPFPSQGQLPSAQLPDVPLLGNGALGALLDTRTGSGAAPRNASLGPGREGVLDVWLGSASAWSCRACASLAHGCCGAVALGGLSLAASAGGSELVVAGMTQALGNASLGAVLADPATSTPFLTATITMHPVLNVLVTALTCLPTATASCSLTASTWVAGASQHHAAPAPTFAGCSDGLRALPSCSPPPPQASSTCCWPPGLPPQQQLARQGGPGQCGLAWPPAPCWMPPPPLPLPTLPPRPAAAAPGAPACS